MKDSRAKELRIETIPIQKIQVNESNARKDITSEGLEELAKNIEQHGLLQPIVVFEEGDTYQLFIGQRRYRACKEKLKWTHIPARIVSVKDNTDALILSFSENIHRLDLDYRDKMNVAAQLLGRLKSVSMVANRLGVSEATVRNYLGYAGVPDQIKEIVSEGKMSAKTALEISRNITDAETAVEIARKVSEIPRRDKAKERAIVATAKENPGKSAKEIIQLSKKQKYRRITIDLTPKVADALQSACEDLDTDPKALAINAVEEWLNKRGFLS